MATLYRFSYEQVFDANGDPLSGAKLYFYASGTSTPKNTYSDAGLTVPNGNPVIADSAGRFGPIFMAQGDYKVVLHTASDDLVWTSDPEEGAPAGTAGQGLSNFKNLLINGSFLMKQRSASSVADDAYSADCWYNLNQSGAATVALQSNQADGLPTNIRLTQPDVSAKRIGLAQIVESFDCRHLRGAPVVLSFRLRSSLAQSIRYAVLAWTGTADAVTSDVVNDWTSASFAPGGFFNSADLTVVATGAVLPAGGVWMAAPPISGIIPASMNNLIVMIWTEGTLAQNATLDLGIAQLEAGDSASFYEYQPASVIAERCYRRYFNLGELVMHGYNTTGSRSDQIVTLPAQMRSAPTINYVASVQSNCSGTTVAALPSTAVVVLYTTVTSTGNFSLQVSSNVSADL